jgi:uncharacterized membrane protein
MCLKEKLKIIGAIVVMLIGIGILIGALTYFPSPRVLICTGNGKVYSYSIDPYYEPALRQTLVFLVLGCLLSGFGFGVLINTYAVYRLQKIDR